MEIDKTTTCVQALKIIERYAISWEQCKVWIEIVQQKHTSPSNWEIDYDALTFRQLIELQEKVHNYGDLLFVAPQILFAWDRNEVWRQSIFDIVVLGDKTQKELQRITRLFEAIAYQPSYEEERAGIQKLNFGFFGTVDWYARRMGIGDHDDVVKIPWTIIYQCLKIDGENYAFQRRYREMINKK